MTDIIDPRDLRGVEVIKHISNPESEIIWAKERAAAKAGTLPRTPCPHPLSAVEQYVDEEPGRRDRPTNLFHCSICHRHLRLADAYGTEAMDG